MPDLNLNFLNVNSFLFTIDKIPLAQYTCQAVDFPGLSLPHADQPTPFVNSPNPGDHIVYDDLTVTFIVDEELRNWLAVKRWMEGLGFPETFEQFDSFVKGENQPDIAFFSRNKRLNEFSDIKLVFLTNHKNEMMSFTFTDCFPTQLSGFNMNVTSPSTQPIVATATFKYTLVKKD